MDCKSFDLQKELNFAKKNEATNNIMALEHKGSWPMSINVKQYGQPLLQDIVLSIVATVYIYFHLLEIIHSTNE